MAVVVALGIKVKVPAIFEVTPVTFAKPKVRLVVVKPSLLVARVKVQPDGILMSSPKLAARTAVFPTDKAAAVPDAGCKLTLTPLDNTNLPIDCVGTLVTVYVLLPVKISTSVAAGVLEGDQLAEV